MASWKQQGLIEAPVEAVWALLEDPNRFIEWNEDTVEVTGVPTEIEKGSTFEWAAKSPLGLAPKTTFEVEEHTDLREIKLRCQTSGLYSRWLLTEARGNTFAEVEMGIDPPTLAARAFHVPYNKGALRRMAERSLDELGRFLRRRRARADAAED